MKAQQFLIPQNVLCVFLYLTPFLPLTSDDSVLIFMTILHLPILELYINVLTPYELFSQVAMAFCSYKSSGNKLFEVDLFCLLL